MKEIVSKNRVYIIIIIIMVIFSLLIGLLAIFNKTKNDKKLYIAFSDESIWLYSDQKYSNIDGGVRGGAFFQKSISPRKLK